MNDIKSAYYGKLSQEEKQAVLRRERQEEMRQFLAEQAKKKGLPKQTSENLNNNGNNNSNNGDTLSLSNGNKNTSQVKFKSNNGSKSRSLEIEDSDDTSNDEEVPDKIHSHRARTPRQLWFSNPYDYDPYHFQYPALPPTPWYPPIFNPMDSMPPNVTRNVSYRNPMGRYLRKHSSRHNIGEDNYEKDDEDGDDKDLFKPSKSREQARFNSSKYNSKKDSVGIGRESMERYPKVDDSAEQMSKPRQTETVDKVISARARNPPGGKSSLFGGIAALGGGINQEESPYSNSKIEKKTNDRSAYLKELDDQVRLKKERQEEERRRILDEDAKKEREFERSIRDSGRTSGDEANNQKEVFSTNNTNNKNTNNSNNNSPFKDVSMPQQQQQQYFNQSTLAVTNPGNGSNIPSANGYFNATGSMNSPFLNPPSIPLQNIFDVNNHRAILEGLQKLGLNTNALLPNLTISPNNPTPNSNPTLGTEVTINSQISKTSNSAAETSINSLAQQSPIIAKDTGDVKDILRQQILEKKLKKEREEALRKEEEEKDNKRIAREREILQERYRIELEEQKKKEEEKEEAKMGGKKGKIKGKEAKEKIEPAPTVAEEPKEKPIAEIKIEKAGDSTDGIWPTKPLPQLPESEKKTKLDERQKEENSASTSPSKVTSDPISLTLKPAEEQKVDTKTILEQLAAIQKDLEEERKKWRNEISFNLSRQIAGKRFNNSTLNPTDPAFNRYNGNRYRNDSISRMLLDLPGKISSKKNQLSVNSSQISLAESLQGDSKLIFFDSSMRINTNRNELLLSTRPRDIPRDFNRDISKEDLNLDSVDRLNEERLKRIKELEERKLGKKLATKRVKEISVDQQSLLSDSKFQNT